MDVMSLLFGAGRRTLVSSSIACLALGFAASTARAQTAGQVFEQLHAASEALYDGQGSWGHTRHGYRMPLRDVAWRADVYASRARSDLGAPAELYQRRAQEAVRYLIEAQAQGGTGVFGFPADDNPEFGAVVRSVQARCPACIRNGWVVSVPGNDVAELYYDHGHALAAVARAAKACLSKPQPGPPLLASVRKAADWALDKPLTHNINYLSSLAKGLALAWQATGDVRYLDRAVELHRVGILPYLDASGAARDAHNAKLEYHGFIVSGLVTLRRVLPPDHAFRPELERALAATVAHMSARGQREPGPYGATWMGTNLMAWHELSGLRPLTADEAAARDRAIALIAEALPRLASEQDAFRRRKALYSYFPVGLPEE